MYQMQGLQVVYVLMTLLCVAETGGGASTSSRCDDLLRHTNVRLAKRTQRQRGNAPEVAQLCQLLRATEREPRQLVNVVLGVVLNAPARATVVNHTCSLRAPGSGGNRVSFPNTRTQAHKHAAVLECA
jgi:hypothetical protein